MSEEECPECRVAVAIGMNLNVCKELDTKETCEELFQKVTHEEISPQKLFDIIKEKAKDSPEKLDILKYIDTLIEQSEQNDKK